MVRNKYSLSSTRQTVKQITTYLSRTVMDKATWWKQQSGSIDMCMKEHTKLKLPSVGKGKSPDREGGRATETTDEREILRE